MRTKNILNLLSGLLLVALVGCGGGGDSAGTPATGSGSTNPSGPSTGTTATPTLVVEVRDANNALTTSIGGSGISTASAKLLDSSGMAVSGRLVTFTADAALVKLSPLSGAVLTDANGVASIQIAPVSLTVSGAGTIKATAALGSGVVAGASDFQVSPANLALRSLNIGSPTLAAFGNRAVSVQVIANGSPVTSPVPVLFTASCGSVTPPTANTDAAGFATVSYKADAANCAGTNVSISASSAGAAPVSGQLSVLAAVATNIQFINAAPAVIYLRDSGAATQAEVSFKVVDAVGNPQTNQAVFLSLVNPGPGVSIDTLGSSVQVTKTSDASGVVQVAVFSGTVPTPVQVRAVLGGNPLISTTSSGLTVASGRPVQKAASIASEKLSLEGLNFDGDTTAVTLSLADRQGNPVPDGTVVNFVSQSGVMIPPTCIIAGGTSQCKSSIRTQGTRPANGRVSVLAYVQGEEDFNDANRNNVYDAGESFTDLGNAYRSDINNQAIPEENANFNNYSFRRGLDFSVPRAGSSVCGGGENGVPNTCDGVWGANEVRKQHLIIFAGSNAAFGELSFAGLITVGSDTFVTGFQIGVSDRNGNSMPTGSTIFAEKLAGSDQCSVKRTFPSAVLNTYNPTLVVVNLEKCKAGDVIGLTITTTLTKTGTLLPITVR